MISNDYSVVQFGEFIFVLHHKSYNVCKVCLHVVETEQGWPLRKFLYKIGGV